MKPELQKQLYEKYPKIFRQKDLPMSKTCMCWGINCGDGWFWLIDNLCNAIQRYVDSRNDGVRIRNKIWERIRGREEEWQVEAIQVKEKFGGLRFYISTVGEAGQAVSPDGEIRGMISFAGHLSCRICEDCGSLENVKIRGTGWVSTLCDRCDKERLEGKLRRGK